MRVLVYAARAAAPTALGRQMALCDTTRTISFEIVAQYRAAFANPAPVKPLDSYSFYHADSCVACDYAIPDTDLYDLTSPAVRHFLDGLHIGLRSFDDGAALRTLLQRAMSFGQSLRRVCADLRAALPPLCRNSTTTPLGTSTPHTQVEAVVQGGRRTPVGYFAEFDDQHAQRRRRPHALRFTVPRARQPATRHLPRRCLRCT